MSMSTPIRPPRPPVRPCSARGPIRSFTIGLWAAGETGLQLRSSIDYFNFDLGLDTATGVESVFSRGLLYGTDYASGRNYRGIWGLYGLYDYAAPNIFRVSSTAGAFGTTGQWWLSRRVALQDTALLGIGYAAGGVIHGPGVAAPSPLGRRAAQLPLRRRTGIPARSATDLRGPGGARCHGPRLLHQPAGRDGKHGSETIERVDVGLTVRVYRHTESSCGIGYRIATDATSVSPIRTSGSRP